MPKHGERAAESAGYVHLPGQRTRLTYYVDEALKAAGFALRTGLNPSAVKLLYEPAVGLLTGNGPQTIDAQARKIRSILSTRPVLNDARRSA